MIVRDRTGIGRRIGRLVGAGWGQAVGAIVSLLALRLYTGLLPPALLGEALLVAGLLTFADGLLGMAFGQVLALFLAEQRTAPARLALGLGLAAEFAWLLLAIAAAIGAGVLLARGLGVAGALLWPLAAIALAYPAIEPLRILGQTTLLLDRHYLPLSAWQASDAAATVAATLALLHLLPPSPWSIGLGLMAGRGAATALFWPPLLGWRALRTADRARAREARARALAFAWPVSVMAPLGWLSLYLDRYMVAVVIGPASAGLLAALAGAVTRPAAIASAALTNAFRPDLLDEAAGRRGAHPHPLRSWIVAAVAVGLGGAAALAVGGPAIVSFLIRYRGAERVGPPLLVLIALAQAPLLATHALDNQVLATTRSRPLLATQGTAVALGLPMIAAGAIWGGVLGAAWGRIANELLKLALAALLVRRTPVRKNP